MAYYPNCEKPGQLKNVVVQLGAKYSDFLHLLFRSGFHYYTLLIMHINTLFFSLVLCTTALALESSMSLPSKSELIALVTLRDMEPIQCRDLKQQEENKNRKLRGQVKLASRLTKVCCQVSGVIRNWHQYSFCTPC